MDGLKPNLINHELAIYKQTSQLKRYLKVIPNLLFTNYRDFILFQNGEEILNSTLIGKDEKKLKSQNIEKTKRLIEVFFGTTVQYIEKTEKLSIVLAKHTRYLYEELLDLWNTNTQSPFKEKLKGLYHLFLKTLIEDLKHVDFIDAYAQTVTYGLLLAALTAEKKIDKSNFIDYLPKSLSILEEIFSLLRFSNIPEGISWIIDKLFSVLNHTDYTEIQKELSFVSQKGEEDPYIYFYENFLKAYDPSKRVEKGVYYTPAAAVHFIVKISQQSLINDFKKTGLNDDGISLLDFASGTGTFLLEAYKVALEQVDKGQKNNFIRSNLLHNFFGFEYLVAPYTVSHLKLTNYLKETGFVFKQNDRARVYLTDTLDDTHYQRNPLFPYISDEGEQATEIKLEKKVWLILGNPPYSNFSKNKKPFIQTLISAYKKDLNEKNINLDDDYIKFIRFAQCKIEGAKYSYQKGKNTINGQMKGAGQGMISIITNNSYLEGITRRFMRRSLYETFDKIYILNLHGNSNIGEPDKNIFDIRIGVSIVLFVKMPKALKEKEVYYFSTLNHEILTRQNKFNFLYNNDLETIHWKRLYPKKPYYWFIEKDFSNQKRYDKGWKLNDIFDVYSSGVKTERDEVAINFTKADLEKKLFDLENLTTEDFRYKYNLPADGRDWSIKYAKQKTFPLDKNNFNSIDYRPFDYRFTYINEKSKGFVAYPRYNVMKHFINQNNIGLLFPRNWSHYKKWSAALVSNKISDIHLIGSQSYIAPLYIYNGNGDSDENGNCYLFKDNTKKDNFTKDFRKFIKTQNLKAYSPEQILGYIYAILFSETYRLNYFEFLKIDFPKIPFPKDPFIFKKLSKLGEELIENHLLKQTYRLSAMPIFAVEGDDKVDDFYHDDKKERLYINKNQYFEKFSQAVWLYEIGGYHVFEKYLKARKGLPLAYEQINHLKKMAASIKQTIEIQKNIDTLCKSWV